MKITSNNIDLLNNTAVALGAFDGVHIAHKVLIDSTVKFAKDNGISACVFTFYTNPKDTEIITTNEKREQIFEDLGVDVLFLKHFDQSIKNMEPMEFLQKYLSKCKYICVGFNFKFGKNRLGSTEDIIKFCNINNIKYNIVNAVKFGDDVVSSTLIREKIHNNEFECVKEMLGRYYSVSGIVEAGDRIGKSLGFPTVNISPKSILVQSGVYLTVTTIDNVKYNSVTNVGGKPTIKDDIYRVETHLIDYYGDCYGKKVEVAFVEKIRDIIKFDNIDDLKSQLKNDVNVAKTKLL